MEEEKEENSVLDQEIASRPMTSLSLPGLTTATRTRNKAGRILGVDFTQ
jgi:hypothetical protein